jgi:hypothetical protein
VATSETGPDDEVRCFDALLSLLLSSPQDAAPSSSQQLRIAAARRRTG